MFMIDMSAPYIQTIQENIQYHGMTFTAAHQFFLDNGMRSDWALEIIDRIRQEVLPYS